MDKFEGRVITIGENKYRLVKITPDIPAKMDQMETVRKIIFAVCEYFSIDESIKLFKRSRRAEIIQARHTVYYLIRCHTNYTLKDIAAIFEQDHTTVIHAMQKLSGYIQVGQHEYVRPLYHIEQTIFNNNKIKIYGQ